MPNRNAIIRMTTAAAAGVLLFAAACTKPEEKESELVVPVQTAAARRSPIQRIIRARGILHPRDQASVVPKISAPVRSFYVNRGDHVRKDQLLAVLENQDLAAAAAEARGNFDQAESNFRNTTAATLPNEISKARNEVQAAKEAFGAAEKVHESRKLLFEQGALPRKQVDEASVAYVQARSQYEVAVRNLESLQKVGKDEQIKAAKAQVDAARGRQQGAEAQLAYSRITSPIDGVVTDRPLYVGEMAGAGAPLLTVMDISKVIARANVPVNDLPFIKVGNSAVIAASDSAAELHGEVTVVSPALDQNSTTAEVWVLAPNPGARLRPGLSVQIAIITEAVRDALIIPPSAVLPSQDGTTRVLVVGPDSLASERMIETGIREEGKVQVLQGLTEGEQVITVGGFGLKDKTKVRVEKGPSAKSDQNEAKS